MMKTQRKAFTLVEIMAASVIMTLIVLSVLTVTTSILNTWNRASGQLQTYFDAGVVTSIIKEDLESAKVKRDGRAWMEVNYPRSVGFLSGENYESAVPLRPPEIMFYSPTLLRPRYTRENLSGAIAEDQSNVIQIPGSVCAIKYRVALKSPFMEASADGADGESQNNAFYGLYRAVIDPKSTALEAMGNTIQGYTTSPDSDVYRYALSENLWNKTCTVINEEGLEVQGTDLGSWAIAPENLLVMNVVDFRVTFAVLYPNPEAGYDQPKYKMGFIPPGEHITVGKYILADKAYRYNDSGDKEEMDSTLLRDGMLSHVDISMTMLSDQGAKEMRALMKMGTLTEEAFVRLVLAHGNTITRRIQFLAEPGE